MGLMAFDGLALAEGGHRDVSCHIKGAVLGRPYLLIFYFSFRFKPIQAQIIGSAQIHFHLCGVALGSEGDALSPCYGALLLHLMEGHLQK